jgi:hypothetical protein
MIRTLGFLTGIVVTGTALALLTDPGMVRPALDSLAGSIRQSDKESIASRSPVPVQATPAAGILPPARLMQRPDSPPDAPAVTAGVDSQDALFADAETASEERLGETPAGEARASANPAIEPHADDGHAQLQKHSAVTASAPASMAASDSVDRGNPTGRGPGRESGHQDIGSLTNSTSDAAQGNQAALPSADILFRNDDAPEPDFVPGHQPRPVDGGPDAGPADRLAGELAGDPGGKLRGEESAAGNGFAADGNWFAFWTPFRSRASADGFARHLNESTGQDIQVLRLGPGEYRVAFFHQGEEERQRHLAQLESASGLRMGGEL